MKASSPSIALGALLVATFGCGSGQYDANAPSAAPSEHGYAKTSSMQEDTAGATTEDLQAEESATPSGDDDATERDSADEVESVHAPAGGPSGPGSGAGP
jgi:hypothetical protein